jgi:Tol biopolymer transport system component
MFLTERVSSRDTETLLVELRGTVARATPLAIRGFAATLSPDGARVAFYRTGPAGNVSLFVAGAGGQDARELTSLTSTHYQNPPAWSPDGRHLAYEAGSPGLQGANAEVYVIDAGGSSPRLLSAGLAWAGDPVWSPDGNELLLVGSERDLASPGQVFSVRADGSGLRALTTSAGGWSPSWSPDGRLIAFVSARDGNSEIYTLNRGGTGLTNITRHPGGDFTTPVGSAPVAWSPDGKRIAFLSDREGPMHVFVAPANSGIARRVSHAEAHSPAWTGTGDCLTFIANGSLFLARLDGSSPTRILALR